MKFGILFLLLATQAQAHIFKGIYRGVDGNGQTCEMRVLSDKYYENNMPHPLNERVKIAYGQDEFIMYHPPLIANNAVFFNHDAFHGILPTRVGAKALSVEMSHEEGNDGPVSFVFMDSRWTTRENRSFGCNGLKYVK